MGTGKMIFSGWTLVLLAALFFLPFLGGVHLFDWDEINFAECAREMILTGNYGQVQIDFQPFWEKPPLFIWLQALSMQLWGVGEYAARFPNAVCGMLTLFLLYKMGNRLHGKPFGWLWAMAYFGSLLPHLYFKSGIIDPWFNLFIFIGLYLFILGFWRRKGLEEKGRPWLYFAGSGIMLGLAVLTKGPVGILIPGVVGLLGGWVVGNWFRWKVRFTDLLLVALFALLAPALWFGYEFLQNGPWFIEKFIAYQIRLFSTPDAGHGGIPGYHVFVLLFGCFPASILAIPALVRAQGEGERERDFRWWMAVLFWVVLILFSIVKSKIIHYSSLAYFPITYLGASTLFRYVTAGKPLPKGIKGGLAVAGLVIAVFAIGAAIVGNHIEWLKPLLAKDPFALANLEADVKWTGWEVIPGILMGCWVVGLLGMGKRDVSVKGITLFSLGMAVFLQLALFFFVGRVEGYSQRAAVEFYESLQEKPVYIRTVGFKSYAHLFYSRKQPGGSPQQYDFEWLVKGEVDREVYLVTKLHKADRLKQYPELEEVFRKNGFVGFGRKQ